MTRGRCTILPRESVIRARASPWRAEGAPNRAEGTRSCAVENGGNGDAAVRNAESDLGILWLMRNSDWIDNLIVGARVEG